MAIAMMLFGSAARGDTSSTSDTDLLLVTESGGPTGIKKDGAEIQILSAEKLFAMAKNGDLFAIHLALEGKIIFDSCNVFSRFKEKLQIKKDYKKERSAASDLGWFLSKYGGNFANVALVNKRIAWCVRTILISRNAEIGKFIFSPQGLENEFSEHNVKELLDLRRSTNRAVGRSGALAVFLKSLDLPDPELLGVDCFKSRFEETGNSVGLSTIKVLLSRKSRSLDSPY